MKAELYRSPPAGWPGAPEPSAEETALTYAVLWSDSDGSGVRVWQDAEGRWRVRPVGAGQRFHLYLDTSEPPGTVILVPVPLPRATR